MRSNWFAKFLPRPVSRPKVSVPIGATAYVGLTLAERRYVLVDEIGSYPQALNPRLDLCRDSVTGFTWGSVGEGNYQLAVALLCHYLEDEREALRLADRFHEFVIAKLPGDFWRLTFGQVGEAVSRIRAWQSPQFCQIRLQYRPLADVMCRRWRDPTSASAHRLASQGKNSPSSRPSAPLLVPRYYGRNLFIKW
jgi:hypothetical protein